MPFTTLNNDTFRALLDCAGTGILVCDARGKILMANKAIGRQFGYADDEAVGHNAEALIPSLFASSNEKHNGQSGTKSGAAGVRMEALAVSKDGTPFPVEVRVDRCEVAGEHYTLAFVTDATQGNEPAQAKKKAEDELRAALQKEIELNELKSRFVSMASHEFRTPLSAVLSSAYLLSKYTKSEEQPQRDKHIQRIVSSVTSLTEILNDFLSVGKMEEGNIRPIIGEFDLKTIMEAMMQELKHLLKKGQSISYQHTGKESIVALDQSMLKHIVLNLLSNAIKFSPEGTVIELRTERKDGETFISVKDHGIGIPAEDRDRLFSRFFRSSNVTNIQGTGLGLHIVKKYVELMGGDISFRSGLGEGTEFSIKFK